MALPRDGREGGAPRGQRPCPPAEGAEEGEGEEERGGAAVLHGRHLRREERSRHPPTRPARTRRGTGASLRAAERLPRPGYQPRSPSRKTPPGSSRVAMAGELLAVRESWHPRRRPRPGARGSGARGSAT